MQNSTWIVIDTVSHPPSVFSKMPLFERKVVDPRVLATRSISGSAVALLAISIPLVAILKSAVLPFVVIGGAALAIAGVWFFGRSKVVATHSKEIAALEATIKDLGERLENVEVMSRYEASLAERPLEAAEAVEVEVETRRTMGSPVSE